MRRTDSVEAITLELLDNPAATTTELRAAINRKARDTRESCISEMEIALTLVRMLNNGLIEARVTGKGVAALMTREEATDGHPRAHH